MVGASLPDEAMRLLWDRIGRAGAGIIGKTAFLTVFPGNQR